MIQFLRTGAFGPVVKRMVPRVFDLGAEHPSKVGESA